MYVLHITNDYSGSKVYMNLFQQLDELGIKQIVYHPIKDKNNIGKNKISFKERESKLIYSKPINPIIGRIFYRQKIHKTLSDIEMKVDFSNISLIHAHTWYSDGGVAYLLSKKYNIPYIIAARNTDLNVFYKYLIHQRNFGKKILGNASKIIVISKIYINRLLKDQYLKNIVQNKTEAIQSGVDSFWINNIMLKKKAFEPQIIYVGNFNKGKNIVNLISF